MKHVKSVFAFLAGDFHMCVVSCILYWIRASLGMGFVGLFRGVAGVDREIPLVARKVHIDQRRVLAKRKRRNKEKHC